MKFKVLISMLLIAVFVCCTVACGNSKTLEPDNSTSTSAAAEDEDEEDEDEEDEDDSTSTAAQTSTSAQTTESTEASTTESTEAKTSESTEAASENATSAQPTEGQSEAKSEEQSSATASTEAAASGSGEAIANTAKSLIGTKFEYGKVGPDTFDNPGFVVYCYKENGISIPRRTKDMTTVGTKVSRNELKNGDIVIFSNEIGGEPDFSGIYIGGGQFISCNTENTPTGTHSLDTGHWSQRFIEGRHLAD